MTSVVRDQTPTLIEVAFFSLPPEDIEGLNSYASIPADAYVDLWRCPSISVLRRLAVLLRCDPAHAFVPVRTLSEATACVLRAGPEFEGALQDRTTDELSRAGAEWAKEPGWSELHFQRTCACASFRLWWYPVVQRFRLSVIAAAHG